MKNAGTLLIAFIVLLMSNCVSVKYISNASQENTELQKVLLVGETTITNQTFLNKLCKDLNEKFKQQKMNIDYLVLPPHELALGNDLERMLDDKLNKYQPTHLINIKKAEGYKEDIGTPVFNNNYPTYVFDTQLELSIQKIGEEPSYKSIIALESWGGVKLALQHKSTKISKKVYQCLRYDNVL